MISPTHITFSQAFFYTGCILTGHVPTQLEALLAAVFSVFPADLDTRQSVFGRLLPFLADFVEHKWGHRGFTHALIPQLIVIIPLFMFASFGIALAIFCGWHSHSWADMMTKPGIQFWWPSRYRCVLPGNPKFRMYVAGWGEFWFAVIMCILAFPLHRMALTGQGATGLVRQQVAFIGAARQTYDAQKGQNEWLLEIIQGRDNVTLQDISGQYVVVAGYGEEGFLIRQNDQVVSVCKSGACDWYAENARVEKGRSEFTSTLEVKLDRVSTVVLKNAIEASALGHPVYLIGNFKQGKETVDLEYGLPSSLPDGVLTEVDLKVQVRHPPDLIIQALQIENESPKQKGDDLLDKWLQDALDGFKR
jgi:inner membrane protein